MASPFTPTIHDVRVVQRGTATAIMLRGTAPLVASSIQEPKDAPRRLVLNLPNATSAVAATTAVGQGPVERVRVAMSPTSPFGTQVTMELSRAASYRLEPSADGNDLSVVFDEPAADPIAALRATPRQRRRSPRRRPQRPRGAAAAEHRPAGWRATARASSPEHQSVWISMAPTCAPC